jgi:hypothetical protein
VLDGPDEVLTDTQEEYLKEMDARWAVWRRTRAELVLFFKVAALDVTEIELRDDLEACVLLMQTSGPGSASYNDTPDGEKHEAVIRHEACRFTIAAIGEYQRNDLITSPSGWFGQRLDDARHRMLARRVEMRRQARGHPVLPRFYRYGEGPLRWWQRLRRRAMIREQHRAWQQHVPVFENGASRADSKSSDASSTPG